MIVAFEIFKFCILHEFNSSMGELDQNNRPTSRSERKRKRPQVNQDNESVSRSFSQLSISQQTEKTKTSTMANKRSIGITSNGNKHHHHHQQQEDNDSLSTNHIKGFKPRYLTMSDKVFKQILSSEIEHDDNYGCRLSISIALINANFNTFVFELKKQFNVFVVVLKN